MTGIEQLAGQLPPPAIPEPRLPGPEPIGPPHQRPASKQTPARRALRHAVGIAASPRCTSRALAGQRRNIRVGS